MSHIHIRYEDVAVPEIHTTDDDIELENEEEGEIDYDDVAIPEIHSKQHPAVSRDTRAKN